MKANRKERVEHLLKEELSNLVLYSLKDPRVAFVTITRVELSNDLKFASVYFSVMGTEKEKKNTGSAFNSAKGFLQREVASNLKLRFTPKLKFKYDASIEYSFHLEKIIKQINDEKKK